MVTDAEEFRQRAPTRIKENYELYTYFCEHVLEKLRLEEYLFAKRFRETLQGKEREQYDATVQSFREIRREMQQEGKSL
jgi:hypothetical protein